jgi:hypothetical protein
MDPKVIPHHENNGACQRCRLIIARYPGLHADLLDWFTEFQRSHPEAHVSCAGRGEQDQDSLFVRLASKARWKQSAHNWNAALDLFCMIPGIPNIYFNSWFTNTLEPALPSFLNWYGRPGAPFYELPHVEIRDWNSLAQQGLLKLVESK